MLLVLQHHLEKAYRFPGSSCPTGSNIRGQMSYGGKCPKGADVLQGRMSVGQMSRGQMFYGVSVLGTDVQGQMS